MATDIIYTNDMEKQVCFDLEVRVPYAQAARFRELLTGNDDDVILAGERGMREALDDYGLDEVELVIGCSRGQLRGELVRAAQYERAGG